MHRNILAALVVLLVIYAFAWRMLIGADRVVSHNYAFGWPLIYMVRSDDCSAFAWANCSTPMWDSPNRVAAALDLVAAVLCVAATAVVAYRQRTARAPYLLAAVLLVCALAALVSWYELEYFRIRLPRWLETAHPAFRTNATSRPFIGALGLLTGVLAIPCVAADAVMCAIGLRMPSQEVEASGHDADHT